MTLQSRGSDQGRLEGLDTSGYALADAPRAPPPDIISARSQQSAHSQRSHLSGTRSQITGKFREDVHTTQPAWRQGMRNTIYAVSGDRYTGEWARDLKEGKGVQVYSNGDRYEGEWEADNRSGQGTFWTMQADGQLYQEYSGSWKNDKRQGLGTKFYANGDVYEGEWADNVRQGWGVMAYENGDKYQGEWQNDVRAGKGRLVYENGNIYEGEWAHDKQDGKGRLFYAAPNQMYEGEWLDGSAKCGTIVDCGDPLEPTKRILVPKLHMFAETVTDTLQTQHTKVEQLRAEMARRRQAHKRAVLEGRLKERDEADAEAHRIGGEAMRRDPDDAEWVVVCLTKVPLAEQTIKA